MLFFLEPQTQEAQEAGSDPQAARPQRKSEIPAYSCASPRVGLLSGEKAITQEAAQRQLLHEELKVVLQQKEERTRELEPPGDSLQSYGGQEPQR